MLGDKDSESLQLELKKGGGLNRIKSALGAIDVRSAGASVATDKELILADIASTTGLDEFSALVRSGLEAEFRRICMTAALR
jgi:hypothetical protein